MCAGVRVCAIGLQLNKPSRRRSELKLVIVFDFPHLADTRARPNAPERDISHAMYVKSPQSCTHRIRGPSAAWCHAASSSAAAPGPCVKFGFCATVVSTQPTQTCDCNGQTPPHRPFHKQTYNALARSYRRRRLPLALQPHALRHVVHPAPQRLVAHRRLLPRGVEPLLGLLAGHHLSVLLSCVLVLVTVAVQRDVRGGVGYRMVVMDE